MLGKIKIVDSLLKNSPLKKLINYQLNEILFSSQACWY